MRILSYIYYEKRKKKYYEKLDLISLIQNEDIFSKESKVANSFSTVISLKMLSIRLALKNKSNAMILMAWVNY